MCLYVYIHNMELLRHTMLTNADTRKHTHGKVDIVTTRVQVDHIIIFPNTVGKIEKGK